MWGRENSAGAELMKGCKNAEGVAAAMLELTLIFTTALLVGFSGALMPGPLTAVTVEHTLRRGYPAAPLATLGHTLLEAVMVILLIVGLGEYLALPYITAGYRGGRGNGAGLDGVRHDQKRSSGTSSLDISSTGEPKVKLTFWSGLIATASNPYWFLWWATVGAGYVTLSRTTAFRGDFLFQRAYPG
jgi:threonine/homoserine/homoserine lactone efflux protein